MLQQQLNQRISCLPEFDFIVFVVGVLLREFLAHVPVVLWSRLLNHLLIFELINQKWTLPSRVIKRRRQDPPKSGRVAKSKKNLTNSMLKLRKPRLEKVTLKSGMQRSTKLFSLRMRHRTTLRLKKYSVKRSPSQEEPHEKWKYFLKFC